MIALILLLLAIGAVVIDLTASHGWADAAWLGLAIVLLVLSYLVRARARRKAIYREDADPS